MTDNDYKGKKRSGTLFRRLGGKRYSLDDPLAKDATIYLRYTVAGKTFTISTKTSDLAAAERKRATIMGPLQTADQEEQLRQLRTRIMEAEEKAAEKAEQNAEYLTVEHAWNEYITSYPPDCGQETLTRYKSHYNALQSWLKRKHPSITRLNEVDKKIAREFAAHIGQKFSPNTFNKYMTFLYKFYKKLEEPAGIKTNPWHKDEIERKRLAGKTNSRRELTIAELKTILEKAEGDELTFHALGIFTGMRRGDCATLRWSEIDLDRGIITRIPNKTKNRSGKKVKIGIPSYLQTLLSATPETARRGYVLPSIQKLYITDPAALSRQIQAFFKSCEIETTRPGTGKGTGKHAVTEVGFHSYRHTYVSLNAMADIPMIHVQKLAGHKNQAMTEHYAHLSDEAVIKYAQALPDPTADTNHVQDADFEMIEDKTLPAWVIDKLESMTSKNWKKIRDELVDGK